MSDYFYIEIIRTKGDFFFEHVNLEALQCQETKQENLNIYDFSLVF